MTTDKKYHYIAGEPFMMSKEATDSYFGRKYIPKLTVRHAFFRKRADIVSEFEDNDGSYSIWLSHGYRLDREAPRELYKLYSMGHLVEHRQSLAELLDILVVESIIVE